MTAVNENGQLFFTFENIDFGSVMDKLTIEIDNLLVLHSYLAKRCHSSGNDDVDNYLEFEFRKVNLELTKLMKIRIYVSNLYFWEVRTVKCCSDFRHMGEGCLLNGINKK